MYIHLPDKNTDVVLLPSASVIIGLFYSYNITYETQTHSSAPPLHPCPVISILVPTSFDLENHTNYPNIHMKLKACFFLATGWAALPTHIDKHTLLEHDSEARVLVPALPIIHFLKHILK